MIYLIKQDLWTSEPKYTLRMYF